MLGQYGTQKWLKGALCALFLVGSVGCYKATFISNPQAVKGVEYDEWTSFFLFGLVGEESFDVREFCPSGNVAEVRTGGNFGTGLVSALTIGIYAPRKVYVTCAAGSGPMPGRSSSSNKEPLRFSIEADAQGHPVRIERHRGAETTMGAMVCVNGKTPVWRVQFAQEQVQ